MDKKEPKHTTVAKNDVGNPILNIIGDLLTDFSNRTKSRIVTATIFAKIVMEREHVLKLFFLELPNNVKYAEASMVFWDVSRWLYSFVWGAGIVLLLPLINELFEFLRSGAFHRIGTWFLKERMGLAKEANAIRSAYDLLKEQEQELAKLKVMNNDLLSQSDEDKKQLASLNDLYSTKVNEVNSLGNELLEKRAAVLKQAENAEHGNQVWGCYKSIAETMAGRLLAIQKNDSASFTRLESKSLDDLKILTKKDEGNLNKSFIRTVEPLFTLSNKSSGTGYPSNLDG